MAYDIRTRRAGPSDAEAIATIHLAAREKAMPWLPVIHTSQEVLYFFKNIVLAQEQVYVALTADQVAGFIAINDDWVNHLYVHPEFWRGGVGSKLLSIAKDASPTLQLWTFQQNTMARSFYGRHEFIDVEETNGSGNEEKTPDVRMAWSRDTEGD